jgi:hypothetical protein
MCRIWPLMFSRSAALARPRAMPMAVSAVSCTSRKALSRVIGRGSFVVDWLMASLRQWV